MNKTEIQEQLDALQKATRRLKKKAADLTSARHDAEQFQKELEEIGKPHYKDTAKIKRKAELEYQIESCRETIAELESGAHETGADVPRVILQSATVAYALLQDLYGRRIETITAVIAPFYRSIEAAAQAAKMTDAAVSAVNRLRILDMMGGRACVLEPSEYLDESLAVIADLEAILTEGAKKSPDLLQFFRFTGAENSPAPTAEHESKQN